jgi:hypothetical protein
MINMHIAGASYNQLALVEFMVVELHADLFSVELYTRKCYGASTFKKKTAQANQNLPRRRRKLRPAALTLSPANGRWHPYRAEVSQSLSYGAHGI